MSIVKGPVYTLSGSSFLPMLPSDCAGSFQVVSLVAVKVSMVSLAGDRERRWDGVSMGGRLPGSPTSVSLFASLLSS